MNQSDSEVANDCRNKFFRSVGHYDVTFPLPKHYSGEIRAPRTSFAFRNPNMDSFASNAPYPVSALSLAPQLDSINDIRQNHTKDCYGFPPSSDAILPLRGLTHHSGGPNIAVHQSSHTIHVKLNKLVNTASCDSSSLSNPFCQKLDPHNEIDQHATTNSPSKFEKGKYGENTIEHSLHTLLSEPATTSERFANEKIPPVLESTLNKMDSSQRAVVCYNPNSPLLIKAGAGSGKTQTLAVRVAFLLLNDVPAQNILIICFARQATEAIRKRVQAVLPVMLRKQGNLLTIDTLHAFGHRCLRHHGEISNEVDVYDNAKQRQLTKFIMEREAVEDQSEKAVKNFVRYVDMKKKSVLVPVQSNTMDQNAYLFQHYEHELHEARRAVDFGDLLCMLLKLIRTSKTQESSNPPVSRNLRSAKVTVGAEHQGHPVLPFFKNSENGDVVLTSSILSNTRPFPFQAFTHIIVDEFQDFSEVQFEILALLAGDACCVTCVGDPNQCIYTWRGAMSDIFVAWKRRFPQTVVKTLDVNYRSDYTIVSALNSLVSTNQKSHHSRDNQKIMLVRCISVRDAEQAVPLIIENILRVRDPKMGYGDIAVLCRLHNNVNAYSQLLRSKDIPVRGLKEVEIDSHTTEKALLAYLRLLISPHVDEDVRIALCFGPDHLGPQAVKGFFSSLDKLCAARRHQAAQPTRTPTMPPSVFYYNILQEWEGSDFSKTRFPELRLSKSNQESLRGFFRVMAEARERLTSAVEPSPPRPSLRWTERRGEGGDSTRLAACANGVEALIRFVVTTGGFDTTPVDLPGSASSPLRRLKRPRGAAIAEATATAYSTPGGGDARAADGQVPLLDRLLNALKRAVATIGEEKGRDSSAFITPFFVLQRTLDDFTTLVQASGLPAGGVVVTTAHSAKGMEWPAVIITNCWVGGFPYKNDNLQEERRLFYVAMSRAISHLVLVTAKVITQDSCDVHESWSSKNLTETPFISSIAQNEIKDVSYVELTMNHFNNQRNL
ncbi:unnamed protein product [Phytomonas sp. Hart1]|nr:unnamed protein product [Phytomonas sp. Hart1]|eukprot:CCW69522.1 unnamed protein product [Phytomonas sp. isolate Hart1]